MKKRILSLILSIAMVLSMFSGLSFPASAEGETAQFVKITSSDALTNGTYLIVYEAGSVAFDGSLSQLDKVGNVKAVTITDNAIEATTDLVAASFTINTAAGTIKSASGIFIGRTTNSNGLETSETTEYTHTFSFDDNGNAIITSSGGPKLLYYSQTNSNRFRYYTTNQRAIALYKLTEGGEVHTHTWDDGVETTAPTCTEAGVKTYTCTSCGETKTEPIAALGHIDVDPEDGLCDRCGASMTIDATWEPKALSEIAATDAVVIVYDTGSGTYAISNNNSSSNPPTAVAVTVADGKISSAVDENVKWNISYADGSFTVAPNGDTTNKLYCTNTNNGVRVGTNTNNVFTIDENSGYIKNTATDRFLGIYSGQDLRCYTSVNSNITGQTVSFYVKTSDTPPDPPQPSNLVDIYVVDQTNAGSVKIWAWGTSGDLVSADDGGWNNRPEMTKLGDDAIVNKEHENGNEYACSYYHFELDMASYGDGFQFSTDNSAQVNVTNTEQNPNLMDTIRQAGFAVYYLYVYNGLQAGGGDDVWLKTGHQDQTCTKEETDTYEGLVTKEVKTYIRNPALGHAYNYEEATYTWNDDNTICTAKAVCANDQDHIDQEDAPAVIQDTDDGGTEYFAAFNNEHFEPQHKAITVPDLTGTYFVRIDTPEDLVAGEEYLIVYEASAVKGVVFNGGLGDLGQTKNGFEVYIKDKKIAYTTTEDETDNPTANATFTLEAIASAPAPDPDDGTNEADASLTAYIKASSGKYIGRTSHQNGLDAGEAKIENTIEILTEADVKGQAVITCSPDGGTVTLRYNKQTGEERFRYFVSPANGFNDNIAPVAIYKKVEVIPEVKVFVNNAADLTNLFASAWKTPNTAGELPGVQMELAGSSVVEDYDEDLEEQVIRHCSYYTVTIDAIENDMLMIGDNAGYENKMDGSGFPFVTLATKVKATEENEEDFYAFFATVYTNNGYDTPEDIYPDDAEHKTVTEATCTEPGKIVYKGLFFKDSKTLEEVIPATGHTMEHYPAVEPTCTEDGNIEYWYCTICEKYFSDEEGGEEIEEADIVDAALGHSWGEWTVTTPATCEGEGEKTRECSRCHETENETIPALGHDWDDVVYEWTQEGEVWKCTATVVCKIDTTHTETETVNAEITDETPATYDSDGSRTWTATFTNPLFATQTKTETIPQLVAAWITVYFVDVNDLGTVSYYTYKDGIANSEKTTWPGEALTTIGPDTDNKNVYKIDIDSNKYDTVIFNDSKQNGAAQTADLPFAADAGENNYVVYFGNTKADDVEKIVSQTAPTCTEDGSITYESYVTGETRTEPIAAPGHNLTHFESVPATCLEEGKVEYWHCETCGKNFADEAATQELDDLVIPALGHDTAYTPEKAPTCTEPGNSAYYDCRRCGKRFEDVNGTTEIEDPDSVIIPALGHDYGEPVWAWSEDYSSATATFTCSRCTEGEGHVLTLDATITSETTAATCTEAGETVYTATVTLNGESYTDTKTVVLPALGHKYGEPEWDWTETEDSYTATATFTCENNCGDAQTLNAEVTSEVIPATPTAAGKTVYTATVTFNDTEYTDTKEDPIPALGIDVYVIDASEAQGTLKLFVWGATGNMGVYPGAEPENLGSDIDGFVYYKLHVDASVYNMLIINKNGDDFKTADLNFVDDAAGKTYVVYRLKNDANIAVENDIYIEANLTASVEPSCTQAGSKTYKGLIDETHTRVVEIPMLPHAYGAPSWAWTETEDGYAATATFTCGNCDHVEAVPATVTSETTPATCTEAGQTLYTATVEFEDETYTATKTVKIEAAGHTMEHHPAVEPTCTEDGNIEYWYCTICEKYFSDGEGGEEIDVADTVDAALGHSWGEWTVTTPATCEGEGKKTHECSRCHETETETIPALGHDWDAPTYEWAEDNSTCTATAVCKNDAAHTETETVNTTYVDDPEATYDAPGMRHYTAEFENELFATQTKDVEIPQLERRLEDGYYLIGNIGSVVHENWTVDLLTADYIFENNDAANDTQKPYKLETHLVVNDKIKVVRVENDQIVAWYPDNAPDYTVDSSHAGDVTIYFNPEGVDDWADFGGYIYIEAPVIVDGFYLIGTMNEWHPTEDYLFEEYSNDLRPERLFKLDVHLDVDDEVKVIEVVSGEWTWYPSEGDNYVVDNAHAGDVTVYFNPEGVDDWADFGGYIYIETEPQIKYFVTRSIALNTEIGVNFKVELHDVDPQNAVVELSWPTRDGSTMQTQTFALKDIVPNGVRYTVTAKVAAAQMTDKIHAVLKDGDQIIDEDETSVYEYAMKYIRNEGQVYDGTPRLAELQNLLRSMLNYGAAAQCVFSYRTDDLANAEISDYPLVDLTQAELDAIVRNTMPNNLSDFGITYKSNTLVLTSAPQYKVKFTVTDADKFANLKVKVTDPKGNTTELTAQWEDQANGIISYVIPEIPAVYLLSAYTLTFEDETGATATATVSEGNYIYSQLSKTTTSQLMKNLLTSMYRYWEAANAYFPQN